MAELKNLVRELEKENPRASHNIAGYIDDNRRFRYQVSSNENLPAAAIVLDLVGKKQGMIYTNLRRNHWIYTYTSAIGGEGGTDLMYVDDSNAVASESRSMAGRPSVRVLAGVGSNPGPLRDAGGLFQAAKGLHDSERKVIYTGAEKVHTREKGLHRALRYYMLAAYAVLGKCAQSNYDGGNYIAALLVDDSGRILSYGVNSGWFHHGETNMLLNYFRANSAAGKFPSNTIIFSTLTPCKQCSKYLQDTRPAESVIFIGQEDTGSRGREGEKFGVHLSAVTDPVRSRVATPIMKTEVIGTKTVKGAWGKPDSTVNVTREVPSGQEKVEHFLVETLLSGKMGEGASVAEQIGQKCKEVLIQSRGTLTYKSSKVRPKGEGNDDQLVKSQVLEYLNTWIGDVALTSELRPIA